MAPRRTAPSLTGSGAALFAALGDETRLQVLRRLCLEGPLSITHLAAGTTVTRQAVTKHLRVLSDAGLVKNSRVGRENLWSAEATRLNEARRCLDAISRKWDERLNRLRELVE